MSRNVPDPSPVSEPFWEATRGEDLRMQFCESCSQWVWYPRAACPTCLDTSMVWRSMSGKGTVYAVSIHRRPSAPEFAESTPYVVALIELVEGARMLSGIVGSGAIDVSVGSPVSLTWERLDDGRSLPLFEASVDG